jgi:hypothetical protein
MLEGHVEEGACRQRVGQVEAFFDRLFGKCQRGRVLCERARVVAVEIARDLVEEYDQGKHGMRRLGPVVEFAGCREHVQLAQPVAAFGIEFASLRANHFAGPAATRNPAPRRPTRVSIFVLTI